MPLQKITEEQLINTCMQVFREKGYNGTSMQDLADACGLTKGNFYHYYPNKEALMEAVLKAVLSYFNHVFFKKIQMADIRIEEKKILFKEKALNIFNKQGGCLMGNTALESIYLTKGFHGLVESFFKRWVEMMESLFLEMGRNEQEAKEESLLAVAQIEGSIMLMQVFKDRSYLEKALDKVLR